MLSQHENDLITRVGPGTLMGDLMRQFWTPALLATELPGPDCDPLRVKLLGENLVAFRDTEGKVGLLAEHCCHRGASLFFGRNEACGLRCVYHGWKFDVTGTCVDMPNEPAESTFKQRVRQQAYPCRERNGVVWTYMGPRATPPPLPSIEGNMLPEGESVAVAVLRECNWLQALEGDIDTSHLGFLHLGANRPEDAPPGTFSYYTVKDRAPRYAILDTDYGTMYGAYRPAEDDTYYWRVAHFAVPYWTYTPTGVLGMEIINRAWVPIDDEHTMFSMMARNPELRRQVPAGQGAGAATAANRPRAPFGFSFLPNTSDAYGRFRLAANKDNDYQIDRGRQRRLESYTGIRGIHVQDQAITESMGPIYDRSQEHLASADAMIIRTRRRLLDAARALRDRGETPMVVDNPDVYLQRSGGVILARTANWEEATRGLRMAFVEHPELSREMVGPFPGA